MKYIIYSTTLLLILGFRPPKKNEAAQTLLDKPLKTENTLLWQISGNGLTKPSYLFGTIHIINADSYYLGKNTQKKLEQSKALIMEMDINNIDVSAVTKLSLLDSNKTVKEYMNDSDYVILRTFMVDSIGIKPYTFDFAYSKLKPFYLEQLIFYRYMHDAKESYEENLSKIAQKNNIPNIGLESFEEQLRFLEEIPVESQLKSMVKTIKNYTTETQQLDQLIQDYKNQDLKALTKSFEEEEDQEQTDKLVKNRNKNWIPKLIPLIESKTCFIAVGAGHLGGENGLIQLLRKEGYTVDPISIDN